jgi:hypothetical protein
LRSGTNVETIVTIVVINNSRLNNFDNPFSGLPDPFSTEIITLNNGRGFVEFKFVFYEGGISISYTQTSIF